MDRITWKAEKLRIIEQNQENESLSYLKSFRAQPLVPRKAQAKLIDLISELTTDLLFDPSKKKREKEQF